jgi:hypothetical protein
MLSGLLWRCPICKVNDSIVHYHRRFRPDKVTCSSCNSVWELHRVKGGDDFRFKAVAGPKAGLERPLAEWYDMMRAGFELVPLDPETLDLETGEELYLKGKPAGVTVIRKDPRFAAAIAKMPPPPDQEDGSPSRIAYLGRVGFYLTNQRLIFVHQGEQYGLPLRSIRGLDVLLDRFVIIRHEKRLIEIIQFEEESPLKWRAYLAAVLEPISEAEGIKLRIPYD